MSPALSEETLARERNAEQQAIQRKRRRASLSVVVGFVILAVLAWRAELDFGLFVCGSIAAIGLINYFDANGLLREIRRRSTKVLVPDFSFIDNPAEVSMSPRTP